MRDTNSLPSSLSREGQRRREQILRLAQQAAARRGRRRRARRAVGLALLLATAIGVGVRIRHATVMREARSHPRPVPSPIVSRYPPTPSPVAPVAAAVAPVRPAKPQVVITQIRTDPGLVERLSVRSDPAGWQRLSDDDLLHRLSDAGKPAGLAYVDGRAMLLFHDEPRDAARMPSHVAPHWHAHE